MISRSVPTLRGVSLTNYAGVARATGIDPGDMLRRAGLEPGMCDDPDARIAAAPVVQLFTDSAAESGCAGFALLMAECRTLATLGPASLLLRHQPTLRAFVETSVRVQRHFSDVVNLAVEDDGDIATLRWDFLPEFDQPQWVEYSIAIGMQSYREVTGGLWRPETAHFTHRRHDDLRRHRRYFDSRLEFDAGFNGLSFPSRMLDLPNVLANPALSGHAERLLGLVPIGRPQGSTTERARHAIYLLVHSASATIERVGETLELHPRALQRQLGHEGLTFGRLLNDTRRELAQRYLLGAHHSLASISSLAGYSSQSAFTRWFTGEFGRSPAAWREQKRGTADAT
jgi:AraC-like DNA-binding protein